MNFKLDNIKLLWLNKSWTRVYFMAFFLVPIPVALLLTSIFWRLPLVKQATEEMKHIIQLNNEIETMMATYTDKDMEDAETNWEQVRNKVPGSYEDVSYLIEDLIKLVSSRGFVMNYTLADLKPAYHEVEGLSLLPISVKLMGRGIDANQTGFVPAGLVQFVELLHEIANNYYGVDLASVMVTGIGDGIKIMDVNFNLWVGFGSEVAYQ